MKATNGICTYKNLSACTVARLTLTIRNLVFDLFLQSGRPTRVPLSRRFLRHRNKIEFRYVDDAFSSSLKITLPRQDVQRAHFRATDNGQGRGLS